MVGQWKCWILGSNVYLSEISLISRGTGSLHQQAPRPVLMAKVKESHRSQHYMSRVSGQRSTGGREVRGGTVVRAAAGQCPKGRAAWAGLSRGRSSAGEDEEAKAGWTKARGSGGQAGKLGLNLGCRHDRTMPHNHEGRRNLALFIYKSQICIQDMHEPRINLHTQSLSCVWPFATPWTVAHPLSIGFFRQEYWSGLPCPLSGDLPNPGIYLPPPTAASLALADRFFNAELPGKPRISLVVKNVKFPQNSPQKINLRNE